MKEEEIVEALKRESYEFRRLYQEHRDLDEQLAELDRKVYLSPEDEIDRKRLRKEKLLKKDRVTEMIREFRESVAH
ncbi:MAG: DUF465 domain-containing protein [Thermodesulfovibrionales bacterium]